MKDITLIREQRRPVVPADADAQMLRGRMFIVLLGPLGRY
jgi:hypothetical protein